MIPFYGYLPASSTIEMPWHSFAAATGASSATTGFAAADVKIYKNGSTTERASAAGITATTDFDSRTGLNLVIIDLSDNTDAGFYAAGARYAVCVDTVTIDSQTVRFWLGTFFIGVQPVNITQISGSAVDTTAAQLGVNVVNWKGSSAPAMTGDAYARLGAPAGASVSADVAAVKAVLPSALVSGRIDASVGAYQTGMTPLQPATAGRTLVVDAAGLADANVVKIGPTGAGTAQTARDIGASVLISSGTGTGQLDVTTGVIKANLAQILGTALTETAGQIAAAFKKLFDVATPVLTAQSVNQTGDSYARIGSPAGASIAADVAAVKTDTAAVKTQTDKLTFTVANQIDANVLDWKSSTAPAMTGDAFARLGAPAGASIAADIAALPTAANVKTQVVAALNTDTYAEPGQGAPGATITLAAKINYLYKAWRNKVTQTSTTYSLYADDSTTVDQKAAVSDDGTTFTRAEVASGP